VVSFSFTDEQVAMRSQLRAFLADRCPPAAVREAWRSSCGWSPERWSELSEMGVVGMLAPAGAGGLGLGTVDLVGLLEELGWAAAPEPVLDSGALAVPLLDRLAAAGDTGAARALRDVASGGRVGAVAVRRPGRAGLQLHPAAAEVVVVVDADGVGLLDRSDAAAIEVLPALDGSRRPATLTLDPATWRPLVTGPAAQELADELADRAAVATAATLVGLADRMLDLAVGYATDRRQFGRPVGAFQAVQHQLADVAVALASARPAVYRAAWTIDAGLRSRRRDASMAKALASDAAASAARVSLQVHGAIGYTWEHDLHLWMKRAWALVPAWGDARWHRARVLAEVAAGVR
jgi:alkylation response protein AidB-like acyl-CoA dehydrogenase